jgi:hypothetical protein
MISPFILILRIGLTYWIPACAGMTIWALSRERSMPPFSASEIDTANPPVSAVP